MELNSIIVSLVVLINILTSLQIIISYFLKKNERIKILYKKRSKNINYRKVLKFTIIFSSVILFPPIYHGTFMWYYIFLPISIMGFLLVTVIYHISLENNGSEYQDITDEDIMVNNREETIDKILK